MIDFDKQSARKSKPVIWLIFLLAIIFVQALIFFDYAWAARVEMQKDVEISDSFDLGPTAFSINAKPGDTVKRTLQVTSRKGKRTTFLVEVEGFEGSNNINSDVELKQDNSGRYNAQDWTKSELKTFMLEHGERQFFDVTINIPESADSGDHYAAVLVSALPDDVERRELDQTAPAVQIISRVGALFFIRVDGDLKEEGSLKYFTVDKQYYEKGPIRFRLNFENVGTVRLTPSGSIEIKNQFFQKQDTIQIAPFNVLRESVRERIYDWQRTDLPPGYYTAILKLNRGYNNLSDEMTVRFWVIPWKKIAVFGTGLLLVIIGLTIIKKKFKFVLKFEKREDKNNEKDDEKIEEKVKKNDEKNEKNTEEKNDENQISDDDQGDGSKMS